jgi:hypothetical protein
MPETSTTVNGISTRMTFMNAVRSNAAEATEETTYLYDGKKYPKIAAEMPVYQRSGTLMNEGILEKTLKKLKFDKISLKNLPTF